MDERDDMWQGHQHQEEEEDPADMVDDAYETFQDNPTQFKKLLEDAEKPFYPYNKKIYKVICNCEVVQLEGKVWVE